MGAVEVKRVKDKAGIVHFVGVCKKTLCGRVHACDDLLGRPMIVYADTNAPVTCTECAKLFCQVKNTPLNAIEGNVLEVATYEAVGVSIGPEGVPHDKTDYAGTPWCEKVGETA